MKKAELIRRLLDSVGLSPRNVYHRIASWSVRSALREQGLTVLAQELEKIEPNLRDQYSRSVEEEDYRGLRELKTRGMHAFQVHMLLRALDALDTDGITVADIGDSSGAHALYMRNLTSAAKLSRIFSVNLDPVAVQKVRARGLEAILSRAEDLDPAADPVDLYASFETLEHLSDPLTFLHRLAARGHANWMVFTVPFRRVSRFGGQELDRSESDLPETISPEDLHILELSPTDWVRLARLAGWRIVYERIYRQYPLWGMARVTAPMWREIDFEGFFGAIMRKDLTLADRYRGW